MAIYNGETEVTAIKNGDKDVVVVAQDSKLVFFNPELITEAEANRIATQSLPTIVAPCGGAIILG